jgi:hypothetical protein
MHARVSSTRSSVLVVLLGNAQQYYLFGWGEVIIHLKLEKVALSTFFFSFYLASRSTTRRLFWWRGKRRRPSSIPPHLPQSFRSTRRALTDIYFFSSSFSGGDACSNTFRVPFLFALCVCVDIKSSAWQTQAQDGRRDSVVPNFSQTRPMRLTPSVTECFLRPTWTEIKRNK